MLLQQTSERMPSASNSLIRLLHRMAREHKKVLFIYFLKDICKDQIYRLYYDALLSVNINSIFFRMFEVTYCSSVPISRKPSSESRPRWLEMVEWQSIRLKIEEL